MAPGNRVPSSSSSDTGEFRAIWCGMVFALWTTNDESSSSVSSSPSAKCTNVFFTLTLRSIVANSSRTTSILGTARSSPFAARSSTPSSSEAAVDAEKALRAAVPNGPQVLKRQTTISSSSSDVSSTTCTNVFFTHTLGPRASGAWPSRGAPNWRPAPSASTIASAAPGAAFSSSHCVQSLHVLGLWPPLATASGGQSQPHAGGLAKSGLGGRQSTNVKRCSGAAGAGAGARHSGSAQGGGTSRAGAGLALAPFAKSCPAGTRGAFNAVAGHHNRASRGLTMKALWPRACRLQMSPKRGSFNKS
mmetsp:Transcript_52671/g.160099  ORF Transcript_52671/g.160099 Transcript_52671/m.160099 type:complete len:304 (+) Transcript_52671:124-1035(+)